jgi:hypothetical protein
MRRIAGGTGAHPGEAVSEGRPSAHPIETLFTAMAAVEPVISLSSDRR